MAAQAAAATSHRIRSYVLRQGRLTPAQQRAFADHWPRFGLELRDPGIDVSPRKFDAVFGRRAPRVLEIGTGNGEAIRFAAAHDLARDYIGIEVHSPGVGRLLNGLAQDGSEHVRLYRNDAVDVLQQEIADGSLDEIRIYFPDPWHKKRHHKRRLIDPEFATLLARKLAIGGRLHLATDWRDYAERMWDVLDATPGLRGRDGLRTAVPRPPWRPETHFEQRGVRLGHDVLDLLYERIAIGARQD